MSQASEYSYLRKFMALALSSYASMFVSIFFSFTFARYFVPASFGRVEVGLLIFDLANWLTEWGWDHGLMTAPPAEFSRTASTHLWVRATLALLPLGFWYGLTCTPIRVALGLPELSLHHHAILAVLALGYGAEKVGLTYKTILERTYKLDHLGAWEFCAVIISYGAAFMGYYLGIGALSIALQRTTEKVVLFVGYFWSSPWKFGWRCDLRVVRAMFLRFGFATWMSSLAGMLLYDRVASFVGYVGGVHQAGLYARAYKMGTFPLMVTGIFGRMTAPLYSAYAGKRALLRTTFLRAQFFKAFLVIPAQLFLIVTASWWIPRLLGQQWVELVPVYHLAALYGLVRSFYDDVPVLALYGLCDSWVLLRQNLIQLMIMLIGFYGATRLWGAWGAALVILSSMIIAAWYLWQYILRSVRVQRGDVVRIALRTVFTIRRLIVRFFGFERVEL